jgi:hypothetical protein
VGIKQEPRNFYPGLFGIGEDVATLDLLQYFGVIKGLLLGYDGFHPIK